MFELLARLLRSFTDATGRPQVRTPLAGTGGLSRG
jgi:hypothetical protein